MKIYIAVTLILIAAVTSACAGGFSLLHVGSADGSGTLQTGKILLVDGTSFILQTDAASKICLAGGC